MTQTRLNDKFAQTKSQNRAALITYIMAYAPDRATSFAAMKGLPGAGADIIELGMPFSDPMADGLIIQQASQIALRAGAQISGVLEMVADFRNSNSQTPIILMGYYNPIQNYGLEKFSKDAALAGADGLLIVDLPPEEEKDLKAATEAENMAWVRLVTPTSDRERIKTIVNSASGFIYYVAVSGVTGTKSASTDSISTAVVEIKKHTKLPVAVGFGIKSAEDASRVAKCADAVVVGSSIVKELFEIGNSRRSLDLVKTFADILSNK